MAVSGTFKLFCFVNFHSQVNSGVTYECAITGRGSSQKTDGLSPRNFPNSHSSTPTQCTLFVPFIFCDYNATCIVGSNKVAMPLDTIYLTRHGVRPSSLHPQPRQPNPAYLMNHTYLHIPCINTAPLELDNRPQNRHIFLPVPHTIREPLGPSPNLTRRPAVARTRNAHR